MQMDLRIRMGGGRVRHQVKQSAEAKQAKKRSDMFVLKRGERSGGDLLRGLHLPSVSLCSCPYEQRTGTVLR
jgi:hypothetical protein